MTRRSGRIEARVELARRTRPRPTGRGFLFASRYRTLAKPLARRDKKHAKNQQQRRDHRL